MNRFFYILILMLVLSSCVTGRYAAVTSFDDDIYYEPNNEDYLAAKKLEKTLEAKRIYARNRNIYRETNYTSSNQSQNDGYWMKEYRGNNRDLEEIQRIINMYPNGFATFSNGEQIAVELSFDSDWNVYTDGNGRYWWFPSSSNVQLYSKLMMGDYQKYIWTVLDRNNTYTTFNFNLSPLRIGYANPWTYDYWGYRPFLSRWDYDYYSPYYYDSYYSWRHRYSMNRYYDPWYYDYYGYNYNRNYYYNHYGYWNDGNYMYKQDKYDIDRRFVGSDRIKHNSYGTRPTYGSGRISSSSHINRDRFNISRPSSSSATVSSSRAISRPTNGFSVGVKRPTMSSQRSTSRVKSIVLPTVSRQSTRKAKYNRPNVNVGRPTKSSSKNSDYRYERPSVPHRPKYNSNNRTESVNRSIPTRNNSGGGGRVSRPVRRPSRNR